MPGEVPSGMVCGRLTKTLPLCNRIKLTHRDSIRSAQAGKFWKQPASVRMRRASGLPFFASARPLPNAINLKPAGRRKHASLAWGGTSLVFCPVSFWQPLSRLEGSRARVNVS
jgi:hypothetical protein